MVYSHDCRFARQLEERALFEAAIDVLKKAKKPGRTGFDSGGDCSRRLPLGCLADNMVRYTSQECLHIQILNGVTVQQLYQIPKVAMYVHVPSVSAPIS